MILNIKIEKITVNYDKAKNEHEVGINFRLPIVADGVIWKNPANHKEGYKLKRGKLTKNVVVKKKIHAGQRLRPV